MIRAALLDTAARTISFIPLFNFIRDKKEIPANNIDSFTEPRHEAS
jgi:hypothetical protein